jgi:RNA polymerase sigma factor (sigma-70 family)
MNKREKMMQDIWITYHPKLQIYLKQLFPSTMDVEDRVSEILLKIFDKLDQYNPKYALSTWIYRVARNTQIDQIRKVNLQLVEYNDEITEGENTPEDLFFKDYSIEEIREIIKTLKPNERELIYLYYYEEQNYREISEITGIPEGTLKYRMSCSRTKIKRMIEESEKYERQY